MTRKAKATLRLNNKVVNGPTFVASLIVRLIFFALAVWVLVANFPVTLGQVFVGILVLVLWSLAKTFVVTLE